MTELLSRLYRSPYRPHLLLFAALLGCGLLAILQPYIDQYYMIILINIGVNIILAVSLNLVNGFTGQFSMGHAGFMAVGAYTSAIISKSLHLSPDVASSYFFFPIALIAGGLVAALFGVLVGVPSLRLRGDYLAIVTLGFGEIIRVIIQNLEFLSGARGMSDIPRLTSGFMVFAIVALLLFLLSNLIRSTYGKGFIAVCDDEIAAQAMGINTTRYKVTAFVIGAFFAGVAGGLYAHYISFIEPKQFDFVKSIEVVVMVIVGGMGHNIGVLFAAILLTVLPEALRPVAEYRMVLYSLALIIIMISRPQGLFGDSKYLLTWIRDKFGKKQLPSEAS